MKVGHKERRTWTAVDGGRMAEIDVYVPAAISDQQVTAGIPVEEAAAERAIQSLRDHTALKPLAGFLLRCEGIASSRIEGEIASTRRVFETEFAPDDVSDRTARQIANSVHVMNEVIAGAGKGVSPDDFNRWHRLLFDGMPVVFEPGAVRTRQNWIGSRTDTPVGAAFIPSPPEALRDSLSDLARFVDRVDVAPLTQAAIAHAHFETIHPFPDGNGRIGRALVFRSWAYRGVTAAISPPISQILAENRGAYIDGLTAYRRGEVNEWLRFFFDVVQSAVMYTHALAKRFEDLRSDWNRRLEDIHADALARSLVDELTSYPITSAVAVADRHDVTARGARAALDALVDRRILTVRTLRRAKRGRPVKAYEAVELFALLDLTPQSLV